MAIELTHSDAGLQQVYFGQFLSLKEILEEAVGEEWIWRPYIIDEHGKRRSCIYTERLNVSIFKREDWPTLISFFKPRIMALDEFWSNVKYSFEALQ